jgi:hypothetical protein
MTHLSPDSAAPKWDDASMPRDARTVAKYVLGGLALAAMLALAPFFLASGLMAPGWAVGIFIAVWLVLFALGIFWIRRKPLWVVPLPLIAAAFWFGGMNAGAAWFGWTA